MLLWIFDSRLNLMVVSTWWLTNCQVTKYNWISSNPLNNCLIEWKTQWVSQIMLWIISRLLTCVVAVSRNSNEAYFMHWNAMLSWDFWIQQVITRRCGITSYFFKNCFYFTPNLPDEFMSFLMWTAGYDIQLHPHPGKLYRIGCVGSGLVLTNVLT